ncbi:MAG: complex I subunit 5 family protein [bacterium]
MQALLNNFDYSNLNLLLVITGILITIVSVLSSRTNIEEKRKLYYLLNLIFVLSFSAVIFTREWLIFIIAWEMVTISTTLMLLWRSKGLAGQYFIIQFLGTSFLIFVVFLAMKQGYSGIMPIRESWLQNLFIFGLGMKSAIFPLHFWLPSVHSQAPAPISAILSGWVVKLGFITYLKVITDGNILLLILGFIMIFYGGIRALKVSNYKLLLGYSSVNQLGFIAIGIASGSIYGYVGSIIHIVIHGFAKSSLFLASSYLTKEFGSRCIYKFKDLWQKQKLLVLNILISFATLMGMPLLAGYNSKYLIKYGLKEQSAFYIKSSAPVLKKSFYTSKSILVFDAFLDYLFPVILFLASLLSILYSIRFLYIGIFSDIFINGIRSLENTGEDSKTNYFLNSGDKSVLIISMLLIFLFSFLSNNINSTNIIDMNYNLLFALGEVFLLILISVFFLHKLNWYREEFTDLPTLDLLYHNVYKFLYNRTRDIYNFIYKDFQYQLLWIPIFLIIILLWTLFFI